VRCVALVRSFNQTFNPPTSPDFRFDKNGVYKTYKSNLSVKIHPASSLHKSMARWLLYHELVSTTTEFMRNCIEIRPEWMVEIAPHFFKKNDIEDKSVKMPKNKGRAAAVDSH